MLGIEEARIGIIGLGYVGLPLAVEFGKKMPTVGFDINADRISELKLGKDSTLEVDKAEMAEAAQLGYTDQIDDLRTCNVFIVTVPTPIDRYKRPDLSPLESASHTLGKILKRGDVAIFESTVYPGVTEEVCVPIMESVSGLTFNRDFFVGYSPERINPGDKEHRVSNILKVTSGSTEEAADFVDDLYRTVIKAGTHKVSSIRVAEASKVIENTQRDINISLINELALIFNRLGIDTTEVLEAASTKWNFLPFRPGLVGGHCVDVDVHDPWVNPEASVGECGLELTVDLSAGVYDAIIIATAHDSFREMGVERIRRLGKEKCVLYDVKNVLPADQVDGRL